MRASLGTDRHAQRSLGSCLSVFPRRRRPFVAIIMAMIRPLHLAGSYTVQTRLLPSPDTAPRRDHERESVVGSRKRGRSVALPIALLLTAACGKGGDTVYITPAGPMDDGSSESSAVSSPSDAQPSGSSKPEFTEQQPTEVGGSPVATTRPATPGQVAPMTNSPGPQQTPKPWVSGLDERPPAAALNLPDSVQVTAPGWTAVEAFPGLTFDFPTIFAEAPGTGKIFVAELNGRIYSFDNDPGVTEKHLVLDISQQTQGNDCGLLGMAFHPEFNNASSPNRGYIYLQYPFTTDPIVDGLPPAETPTRLRLSRFTVDLETLQADPASELVLIDQQDENIAHQGSPMFFNPDDGFLYYAVGDEGVHDCGLDNCQMIDKDLYSGVLRIDVDMRGGEISHPIPRQPATGTTANYFIPNDNPFVGRPGVLEEFYAIGLREPHRMTYDKVDKLAWIGDVGQQRIEEIDVLQKGANYEWAVLEGALQVFDRQKPADPLGIWTDPLVALGRDEGAYAVIGGYVYRGSKNPYLYGKYIFGDFVSGNIWALSYAYDGTRVTTRNRELLLVSPFQQANGIVSFGVDRNDELYILPAGTPAKIYTLGRTEGFTNAPARLSQTGVFVDTASAKLEASPGLIPYDVSAPLWSDGAEKRRWAYIPDGRKVAFSESGNWSFPAGSVLVKHFELALNEAQPELKRRLETRLLLKGSDGKFQGLTYKWNEAGTDADLLLERELEPMEVALAGGQTRSLRYLYPGPNDCPTCHTDVAGPVLGIRTSQLNHDMPYPDTGRVANQVFTWGQTGLLDVAPDQASIERSSSLAALDDETAPAEDRLRSYWASNCSMCHRGSETAPGIFAAWDARYEVPLQDQGVIDGRLAESAPDDDARVVVPGDLDKSVLYQRSNSTLPGYAMPPLGRSSVDPKYVALLEEWIRSLSPSQGPTP
jgi:uncharacterized repeat protein (TIGR03806 family)